jgi:CheY-like chemotaxis protein
MALRALPPDHSLAEPLREISEAARRGGDLTRRLLAFSRKQIIKPRLIDLGAATLEFGRMMRRIVGEDVELVIDPPGEPVAVSADAVQLEQVLMNLCTNARQAMPRGGTLRISTTNVDIDAAFVSRKPWARPGRFAELVVSDAGVGMDEATVLRACEPFFSTKPDGTGLGLSTVHGIVQQHGGFLHIESTLGKGTTVRVFLPRASEAALESPPASSAAGPALGGRETILLAEDEASLRSLVTRTLRELGYRVIVAEDGEQAVKEFERMAREIDLALLDVVLPRLDARQVYERIRAVRPEVKVLFTTGYAPASTRMAELLVTGEVPLLEKPFTTMALATSVRHAIDGRREPLPKE